MVDDNKKIPAMIEFLRGRIGESEGVTCRDLTAMFDIKGTQVRNLVNEYRRMGEPICANANGYFYASTSKELLETIGSMRSRIEGIGAAVAGLEKSLEDMFAKEIDQRSENN